MIVACRYCERPLPSTALDDDAWDATCALCAAFKGCDLAAVLVVSRPLARSAPAFEELLRGVPNVRVIVDRRVGHTRRPAGESFPVVERRHSDRRRGTGLMLA